MYVMPHAHQIGGVFASIKRYDRHLRSSTAPKKDGAKGNKLCSEFKNIHYPYSSQRFPPTLGFDDGTDTRACRMRFTWPLEVELSRERDRIQIIRTAQLRICVLNGMALLRVPFGPEGH